MDYLKTLILQLRLKKGKGLTSTTIETNVKRFNACLSEGSVSLMGLVAKVPMGTWMHMLTCHVVIQIERT